MDYGKAYLAGQSFIAQLIKLKNTVPHPSLNVEYPSLMNMVNFSRRRLHRLAIMKRMQYCFIR